MLCNPLKKTHFMCTKGISENYFKIKDLDINSRYQYTKVMRPPGKHVFCGLKKYEKQNYSKSKI